MGKRALSKILLAILFFAPAVSRADHRVFTKTAQENFDKAKMLGAGSLTALSVHEGLHFLPDEVKHMGKFPEALSREEVTELSQLIANHEGFWFSIHYDVETRKVFEAEARVAAGNSRPGDLDLLKYFKEGPGYIYGPGRFDTVTHEIKDLSYPQLVNDLEKIRLSGARVASVELRGAHRFARALPTDMIGTVGVVLGLYSLKELAVGTVRALNAKMETRFFAPKQAIPALKPAETAIPKASKAN